MPIYITTQARTIANRALKAGDEFRASKRDGDLLVRLGRAELKPAAFKVPPPPKPVKAAVTTPESEASGEQPDPAEQPDPLAVARDDYERIVGKRWFHGWDESELRRRIAEHESGDGSS